MRAQTELQTLTCAKCGAAIGRHEPLVIVSSEGERRSTLALESRPPVKGEAIYHPGCHAPAVGDPGSGEGGRVFREALCGVDGGDGSFAAVEQAARLVGPGGHLTILVVTALRTGVGNVPATSGKEMVERASALADRFGVSCRVEVDPARPVHQVIRNWAAGHDLLAIGAPPHSVLAGLWFSGVTDTAMRSLPTPLLVARPGGAGRFGERMLVASDGLRDSDELVAFANRIANDAGSTLTLMHALERRTRSVRPRIEAQAHTIGARGLNSHRAMIEPGHAEDAIIGACSRLEASLVVMSSRRRSGLGVVGSVSRRVVHHGGCSVLLVPPERLQSAREPAYVPARSGL